VIGHVLDKTHFLTDLLKRRRNEASEMLRSTYHDPWEDDPRGNIPRLTWMQRTALQMLQWQMIPVCFTPHTLRVVARAT